MEPAQPLLVATPSIGRAGLTVSILVVLQLRWRDSIRSNTERLMSPRLKHTTGFLTLVSIYAPKNQAYGQDKDQFYQPLSSVVEGCKVGETVAARGLQRQGRFRASRLRGHGRPSQLR